MKLNLVAAVTLFEGILISSFNHFSTQTHPKSSFKTFSAHVNQPFEKLDAIEEKKLVENIREYTRIHEYCDEYNRRTNQSLSVEKWATAVGYENSEDFIKALQNGKRSQKVLIKSQQRMVQAIARKYAVIASSLSINDLVQEGNVGLMKAVEKFDPKRGASISQYAGLHVKAAILRSISNKDDVVRLPVYVHDTAHKIRRAASNLSITLNREPTVEEIAKVVELSPKVVSQYRSMHKRNYKSSSDSNQSLLDAVTSKTEKKKELSEVMKWVLDEYLEPRETKALSLRFGLDDSSVPLTFSEVGKSMHLSGEGIRRIVTRALRKLKEGEAWNILSEYSEFA
mmetsp:Transcript_14223/g.21032  ORF Transcript_14223/g.21032 Transcript_14223/m.21032 type:complete len:340 (-) Transcript_14223:79-1098(-)